MLTEHRPVDDEDEGLEERVRDGGHRQSPDLSREGAGPLKR